MTQIEDRLRTALATAPTPVTSTGDPLDELSRRVGRARRRLVATAVVAAAVLVAAIVVPLDLLGSAGGRTVPAQPAPSVPFATWPVGSVGQFASGGGSIWTLGITQRPGQPAQTLLQRRDPRTGQIDATYQVPHSNGGDVSYGLGKVWVWTFGDGGDGGGSFLDQLTVVNPQSGQVVSSPLGGERPANSHPYDFYTGSALAVAGTTMVGVQTNRDPRQPAATIKNNTNRVLGFVANDRFAATIGERSLQGVQSVLGGHGTLLLLGENGVIGQYPTSAGWPQSGPGEPVRLTGLPMTAAAQGFWAVSGDRLLHEDLTGRLISPPVNLPLEHIATFRNDVPPVQAAVDTAGGLYVTVANSPRAGTLLYYSPAALRAAQPAPTAVHYGPEFIQIVADPAGGVVVVANTGNRLGTQQRWDPATP